MRRSAFSWLTWWSLTCSWKLLGKKTDLLLQVAHFRLAYGRLDTLDASFEGWRRSGGSISHWKELRGTGQNLKCSGSNVRNFKAIDWATLPFALQSHHSTIHLRSRWWRGGRVAEWWAPNSAPNGNDFQVSQVFSLQYSNFKAFILENVGFV